MPKNCCELDMYQVILCDQSEPIIGTASLRASHWLQCTQSCLKMGPLSSKVFFLENRPKKVFFFSMGISAVRLFPWIWCELEDASLKTPLLICFWTKHRPYVQVSKTFSSPHVLQCSFWIVWRLFEKNTYPTPFCCPDMCKFQERYHPKKKQNAPNHFSGQISFRGPTFLLQQLGNCILTFYRRYWPAWHDDHPTVHLFEAYRRFRGSYNWI